MGDNSLARPKRLAARSAQSPSLSCSGRCTSVEYLCRNISTLLQTSLIHLIIDRPIFDNIMALLNFCRSHRIAPAVRKCHLQTCDSDVPEDASSAALAIAQEIVRAVFHAFRSFNSLRGVFVYNDEQCLQVTPCSSMNTPTPINTILLNLQWPPQIGQENDSRAVEQVALLCASLRIAWDLQTDFEFMRNLCLIGPFSHLRRLSICPARHKCEIISDAFTGLLNLCPALEELTVRWCTTSSICGIRDAPAQVLPGTGRRADLQASMCSCRVAPYAISRCLATTRRRVRRLSWVRCATSRSATKSSRWTCVSTISWSVFSSVSVSPFGTSMWQNRAAQSRAATADLGVSA
ncbi:hypothetical protein B0H10DRAFT_2003596 [Mycena sp. CBHHK59/15]|nr:hypothetical protein B0H10DRAFT_2003596 [Mycena sp. CBHHK59/15]